MIPNNILCFSPVRWDFTFNRPQHLLLRFARLKNIYFFEDPVFDAKDLPFLTYSTRSETLWKIVPHLNAGMTSAEVMDCLEGLVNKLFENSNLESWIFWYYSPHALSFTEKYKPKLIVYDEIKAFSQLNEDQKEQGIMEKRLSAGADLIFRDGKLHCELEKEWDDIYGEMALLISDTIERENKITAIN